MGDKKTFYAMVISRCMVDGERCDSIDVSAYMVRAESEDEVRSTLENATPISYSNSDGGAVRWPMLRIMSIDECHNLESGDEVTGFIFQKDEFDELV